MQRRKALSLLMATLFAIRWSPHAWADEKSVFEKPVRLEADGKIIDTGDNFGHAGPTMADVDGDGIPDLVVGDYSGQFRVYRNLARTGPPRLGPMSYLVAGRVPAKVPIYCCIGSSPQFVDFDGDGQLDLISGSYDPGACYLFRGLGKGRFAARETLVDKTNKPLLRAPQQQLPQQSFGSWPALVDWDGDGDLDLLIGGFDGTIRVFLNEGTRNFPQFAVVNFKVQADARDLIVPGGHAAPVVVDWDNDGRWDILCGCDQGSVYWYRNIGTPTAPKFAAPKTLVPKHRGMGYDDFRDIDEEPVPGISSQIAAVDYDRDGHVDLLLGDFCTTLTPKRGLTAAQRTGMLSLVKQRSESRKALKAKVDGLEAEFVRRYPGDAFFGAQAHAEWIKALSAMRETKAFKDLVSQPDTLDVELKPLLETPPQQRWVHGLKTCHGYVWLYRRKPVEPAEAPSVATSAPKPAATEAIEERSDREPVIATVTASPTHVQPGGAVTLTVDIKIGIGWHIHAIGDAGELSVPTRLDLKLPALLTTVGDWDMPKPDVGISNSGRTYSGEVRFIRQLKVGANALPGNFDLVCKLGYQACDDRRCLRPMDKTLRVPLEIVSRKQ